MTTRGRYTFDTTRFVVVTPFEYGGRFFVEGEVFPWDDFGLVEYQRRVLWMANKIGVAPALPPESGLAVLARIGAAIQPEPAKPSKRSRAGA